MIADQAADAKLCFFWMVVNEIDQSPAVVSMDMQFALASTVRTCLQFRPEVVHTILKNGFSGSFFPDELAINRILSYHNNALKVMLSHEIRATTL